MGNRQNKRLKRHDQRITAWEFTLKTLPSNQNPLAFKKPGSRNHKKLRNR